IEPLPFSEPLTSPPPDRRRRFDRPPDDAPVASDRSPARLRPSAPPQLEPELELARASSASSAPRSPPPEPFFRPVPPDRDRSPPSRFLSGRCRRVRFGGGATGRTRACTRASPRIRPNRPALGSLR